ncbi:response regulator [Sulfurimonas sp. MAG313]|nr:response regulator [Sulfurimonas sp. MAG313]MDF1881684.1 response regulator [Sulfurimonas sp. MAG313]
MEHLHDLMELGKGLKVLYVEDDENLRLETTKIIERIFEKVDVASDGVEGFNAFSTAHYDLVITDIEMPQVDGIEMSRNIRAINKDTPIVVVSAYSNTDYFMDAIAIGIDYYILKPIKMPRLIDTLFAAVKRVVDKRIADGFRQQEIKNKMQKASENMLAEITNVSPNPTIVYSNGSITFMNRAFKELFDENDLKKMIMNEKYLWSFLNEKISIDNVVHSENDFIEQLDDFNTQGNKHKISLRTNKGRKIFFVFRNPLNLENSKESAVYTFNDITVIEYQKVQINQYNEYMNELMYTKYKSNESQEQPEIIDKVKF